jgi:hypothetical protein
MINSDHTKADFDWVTATSACTVGHLYEQLLAGAKGDVQVITRLTHPRLVFDVIDKGDGFSVIRKDDETRSTATVRFQRQPKSINVTTQKGKTSVITIGSDANGNCCALIDNEKEPLLYPWNVRQRFLQALFFD